MLCITLMVYPCCPQLDVLSLLLLMLVTGAVCIACFGRPAYANRMFSCLGIQLLVRDAFPPHVPARGEPTCRRWEVAARLRVRAPFAVACCFDAWGCLMFSELPMPSCE